MVRVHEGSSTESERRGDAMSNPILCHKCGGALTGDDKRLYSCHCISGYVRDWQEPSKNPIQEQLERLRAIVAHFDTQGRDEYFMAGYRSNLARLEAIVAGEQLDRVLDADINRPEEL